MGGRFAKATLVKVIVFTVVALLFAAALAVKLGNIRPFGHTYTLNAVFDNASGVFRGDSVKVAGVDVGSVQRANIDNGHAVVTFTVDRSVKLTSNTKVALRWRNVLGQRFLYLYPEPGGRTLSNGDTIPVSQTIDAGDLDEFLNDLGPILRAIDPTKANAFIDAMNTALGGNVTNVRELIDASAQLAGQLGSMDKQIQTLLSSSDTVLSTYARQNKSIAKIIDDLNSVGGTLSSETGAIDTLVTNFADVQTQLSKLLNQNRSNIDADIADLNSVTTLISQHQQQLATVLCTTVAGVTPYFQTTSWGEWFNVRITQIVLKDRNSNIIFRQSETPNERGGRVKPPYVACGKFQRPTGKVVWGSQVGPASANLGSGSSDLSGFMGWVLAGNGGGGGG